MQFEFDETGGSFYYFLVSFYLLLLLPLTYFFWPRTDDQDLQESSGKKCRCDPCQTKLHFLSSHSPNKRRRRKLIQAIFIIAWVIFFILTYKVSQIEMEWNEFDPFGELGVSKDATTSEIRKAYKMLSLKFHPDKGGDPKKFIRLTKAYAALTNEQSRKNWQEHGNPDGPGATQFGIALPKWIVEKKNSVWVLGVYVLLFMVVLPVSVGIWWYRTIKFNSDKILLNTTQLYFFFFNRTPNMPLKRVLTILTGSFEFNKANNSEIVERPSDNFELPALLKHFPQINIKTKEMPFAAVYSVKARVLLYSHLNRFPLPMHTLNNDKNVIVKKCPYLINEMINIVAQLVAIGHQDPSINVPRLDTVEHCMKISQMIVQAVSEKQSSMLQLPHITEDILRHFVTKKRNVRSIRQLVEMKEEDRRSLLRTLSDDQYRDLITVCSNMPLITMDCNCEVRDEDDSTITPRSIVTVTVCLYRKPLGTLFPEGGLQTLNSKWNSPSRLPMLHANKNDGSQYTYVPTSFSGGMDTLIKSHDEDGEKSNQESKKVEEDGDQNEDKSPPKKKPIWDKNRKKKNISKAVKSKTKKNKPVPASKQNGKISNIVNGTKNEIEEKNLVKSNVEDEEDRDNTDAENEGESIADNEEDNDMVETGGNISDDKYNDEEDNSWKRFQEEARKENSLETRARTTHLVHCPYFSSEKYEWWWVYLCDRRSHALITAPLQVCSLQDEEELQLKFTAPDKPGQYFYTVCLRSDSYLDFDMTEQIKITVKEEQKRDYDAQWKISDEEDNSYITDESEDDDDGERNRTQSIKKKALGDDSTDDSKERQKKRNNTQTGMSGDKSGGVEDDDFSSNTDYDYDD